MDDELVDEILEEWRSIAFANGVELSSLRPFADIVANQRRSATPQPPEGAVSVTDAIRRELEYIAGYDLVEGHALQVYDITKRVRAILALLPAPQDKYCTCANSKTNPCIMCGKPKFIDPEWLKQKLETDPDEGEIGVGFELFPLPAPQDASTAAEVHEIEKREAFKAGWWTNAAYDQPASYLEECEEVDFGEYLKKDLDAYVSDLLASAREEADAQPAPQDASPAQVSREKVAATLKAVLRNYRQQEVGDGDGGGYPLVDALTLDGHGIDMVEREIDNIVDALMVALAILSAQDAPSASLAGWWTMDSAPKDGTRILLAWAPYSGISEHVELGKWKHGLGWCNTYGKPFSGEVDAWAPLAPFSLPASPEQGEAK